MDLDGSHRLLVMLVGCGKSREVSRLRISQYHSTNIWTVYIRSILRNVNTVKVHVDACSTRSRTFANSEWRYST
jgi:hypothetical protein